MNRKVGTIGYSFDKNTWAVEVIDYTNRAKERSLGVLHLSIAELNKGRNYIDQLVAEKVYNFMVDEYGEDVSYTLDAGDF